MVHYWWPLRKALREYKIIQTLVAGTCSLLQASCFILETNWVPVSHSNLTALSGNGPPGSRRRSECNTVMAVYYAAQDEGEWRVTTTSERGPFLWMLATRRTELVIRFTKAGHWWAWFFLIERGTVMKIVMAVLFVVSVSTEQHSKSAISDI